MTREAFPLLVDGVRRNTRQRGIWAQSLTSTSAQLEVPVLCVAVEHAVRVLHRAGATLRRPPPELMTNFYAFPAIDGKRYPRIRAA